MDRRIRRTKRNLQQALLTLLHEKPLEAITIQEITDLADTARVTFYRHYGTKEELLIDAIEGIYQQVQASLPTTTVDDIMNLDSVPPPQILFEFLASDRAFHKRLFTGSVSALIQQRIRVYIVEQVNHNLHTISGYNPQTIPLIANHVASVTIGNIMWWLTEDIPYTPAEMGKLTHTLAIMGVRQFTDPQQSILPIG